MKKLNTATLCAALLLLASSAAACGGEAEQPVAGTSAQEGEKQTEEQAVTEKLYTDAIASADMGGMEFRIFTSNALNGYEGPTTINTAADENGEPVNDALYARDRWLEEHFNVTVKTTDQKDESYMFNSNFLKKLITAGDDQFDMILQDIVNVSRTLAVDDAYIYALDTIDTIHLDADYWMPALNKPLNIGDHTYFAACPASPRYYTSAYVLLFNKNLARDLDIENLYDLVKNGTWTIDKLSEISKLGLADVDGNGVYDVNDRYGFLWHSLAPTSFVLGAGYNYVENKNGTLVCNLDNAAFVNYIDKVSDLFRQPSSNTEFYDDIAYNGAGNFLFCAPATMELNDYREVNYDYGILPFPKQNAEQKDYITYAQPWILMSPTVPVTITGDRVNTVGTLVDAYTAYGLDYIRPAVFNNVLQVKGTRDEESAEIINRIYDNITFDLMTIFKFEQLSPTVSEYWANLESGKGIQSMYAAITEATAKSMQTLTETLIAHAEN